MYCENCGEELADDAVFCANCGTRVEPEGNAATAMPAQTSAPKHNDSNKKHIIIAVVCACVVLAVGIGIIVAMQAQKHKVTHATVPIPITFTYTDNGSDDPIGVPLLIEGTDLDNKHVEMRVLAPASGDTVELQAGSYSVSVAGPTANRQGAVYKVQGSDSYALEVPVPGEDDTPNEGLSQSNEGTETSIEPANESGGEGADASSEPAWDSDVDIKFTTVSPESVTDEDIEEMKKWMEEYGIDSNETTEVVNAVTKARDKELARINLEKEKQTALNANPSVVPATHDWHDPTEAVRLTGTVRVQSFKAPNVPGEPESAVCFLELPRPIRFDEPEFLNDSSESAESRVILGDEFSKYNGKVITISAWYYLRYTMGDAMSQCSPIIANDEALVRVFE